MLQEWHYFFENTLRWRNLRKITIAQVHGPVYSAGLMLMWACDLIVAAESTIFADVVGTRLGMCGLEYFAHPWEFGPRKTKELPLTGDSIDVDEAHRLGMVSKIFPPESIEERTLQFAGVGRGTARGWGTELTRGAPDSSFRPGRELNGTFVLPHVQMTTYLRRRTGNGFCSIHPQTT